jgi:hypothetical protein
MHSRAKSNILIHGRAKLAQAPLGGPQFPNDPNELQLILFKASYKP